jgi:hypothetical protein
MRHWLSLFVLILLAGSPARAQAPAVAGAPADALSIVGRAKQQGFLLRLGDPLALRASGNVAKAVLSEWQQSLATRNLTLQLDGVAMKGLDFALESCGPDCVDLTFVLARDPNDDASRALWNTLLARESGYVMTFPVSLAIGRDAPIGAKGPDAISFEVADPSRIKWVRNVALVVFGAVFLLLVKWGRLNPMLRDADTGYFSLGKAQLVFWGLLVFLASIAIFSITGKLEHIPTQALTLLGISGATGLGAVLIGKGKRAAAATQLEKLELEKGILEKAQAASALSATEQARLAAVAREMKKLTESMQPAPSPSFFRDICDDGNGYSFHRVQVVIWTLLLGWAFVSGVDGSVSMPEFSDSLLLLMGISNGTYLGLKLPE